GFADLVQTFETEGLFVRGHLPDAVGAGVENRLAGAHMLFTKLGEDIGSACGLVAEYAGQIILAAPTIDHLLREAIRVRGEGLRDDEACHFPMAGGGVLAE